MRAQILSNPIVNHTIEFSLGVIEYVEILEERRKYVIAKQILRSGTAIGALTMEAQTAESKADFIHKLKIAEKEALETWYWLLLCKRSKNYPDHNALSEKLDEILKILYSILKTSKQKTTN